MDRQVGPYFAALRKEPVATTATRLEERSPRIRVSGALTDPGGPLADLALEFGTRGLAGLRPNDFGQCLQCVVPVLFDFADDARRNTQGRDRRCCPAGGLSGDGLDIGL